MSIEAMKQALEALESCTTWNLIRGQFDRNVTAITSLRQAIEEAEKQDGDCQQCGGKGCVACDAREQEPVAWISKESGYRLKQGGNIRGSVPVHAVKSSVSKIPLYTHPPKREWQGLTDEEKISVCKVGAVYAPDGVVTRRPIEYRRELEDVALTAILEAEAKLKQKNGYEEKNT